MSPLRPQTHQPPAGPEPARLQRLLLGVRVAGGHQDGALPRQLQYNSLQSVARMSIEDVMSLGISLVGHQKKVMSSIQTMRAQVLHLHGTGVQV
ncbi:ephrin type-A receptor 7-like [Gadus macrocephalus]|uniref:ephrin type-A receptor 7-like n=1 Tax=Gadus macrocephalus TaxID=80720 RepID=UPI0028CBB774|nr:ephrin type-A receptor 7-like [Gadus macrocephalus]